MFAPGFLFTALSDNYTDLCFTSFSDWTPSHSDRHIISVVGDVIPMDLRYKLPNDINSYAFSKYTSVYFKVRIH